MNERIVFTKENHGLPISPELQEKFSVVMQLAAEAKAYPDQSGYFVRTAGVTKDGNYYKGGNKEYGQSDAFIHGETAVVSGLRDLTDSPIEVIGWHKDGEITAEDFGRPCGNCRDVLKKYCSPETYLLNGNDKAYVVTQLKDFLFDDLADKPKLESSKSQINLGLRAARGGNDVYFPEYLKGQMYGAVLISETGKVWPGLHYTNVGYDSVTAVLASILVWRSSFLLNPTEDHLHLSRLLVLGETKNPQVFYRDRQAILELDEVLRKYTKKSEPLIVETVGYEDKEVSQTNTEQWLPGPFSPGAFRMDDVMLGQLGKIIGTDNLKKLGI